MNILITGGYGFLGSILISNLLSNNNTVFELYEKGKTPRIDITQPFEIAPELLVDTIIHCAGKAHVIPSSAKEDELFYKVNHQGTINLCNALDKLIVKPKAFIFISSVAVYGIDTGVDINEDHPLKGVTPYARSKILAEAYLQDWAKRNDIILSILRLPLIAGPNPLGNLRAMIKGLKSGKYVSIGNADARKSILWGEDIANIIPKLVKVGGIYNFTDGYHPSFGELEESISKAIGKSNPKKIPMAIAKALAKLGDLLGNKAPINTYRLNKITSTMIFDDSKAKEIIGWNPTRVLDKINEII